MWSCSYHLNEPWHKTIFTIHWILVYQFDIKYVNSIEVSLSANSCQGTVWDFSPLITVKMKFFSLFNEGQLSFLLSHNLSYNTDLAVLSCHNVNSFCKWESDYKINFHLKILSFFQYFIACFIYLCQMMVQYNFILGNAINKGLKVFSFAFILF